MTHSPGCSSLPHLQRRLRSRIGQEGCACRDVDRLGAGESLCQDARRQHPQRRHRCREGCDAVSVEAGGVGEHAVLQGRRTDPGPNPPILHSQLGAQSLFPSPLPLLYQPAATRP